MSSNVAAGARPGASASSIDSGQGSEPLSDAFVAVPVPRRSKKASSMRVEAPEGSSMMLVRRSTRVASAMAKSVMADTAGYPAPIIIRVPPALGRTTKGAPLLLPSVAEESPGVPLGLLGNAGGLRDTSAPRVDLSAGASMLAGRKRSASSAAPGYMRRPKLPHIASAADFSPTHFDEPQSDGLMPPHVASAAVFSPTHFDDPRSDAPNYTSRPASPTGTGLLAVKPAATPMSSPLSQNPLLQRDSPMVFSTPSPSRRRSASFRTRDSHAAWEAAEGLLPIREGFTAPGYRPAQVVGGITYKVHSPTTRRPGSQGADIARQLFDDLAGPDEIAARPLQGSMVMSSQAGRQLAAQQDPQVIGQQGRQTHTFLAKDVCKLLPLPS
jgi:hypothetical protein